VGPQGSTTFPMVFVAPSRPQIFMQPGTTVAVAINQDGTLNSPTNGAPAGSVVTIWATGTGITGEGSADGGIAGATGTVLPISLLRQAGTAWQSCGCETYAGNAPDEILGLTQVNFVWPSGAGNLGELFELQAGDSTSAPVLIYGR
jgi:uncharacterized protein (TIGR03437 family)